MDAKDLVMILLGAISALFAILMKVQSGRLTDKDAQIAALQEQLRDERQQGDKLLDTIGKIRPLRSTNRKERVEEAESAIFEMTGEIHLPKKEKS